MEKYLEIVDAIHDRRKELTIEQCSTIAEYFFKLGEDNITRKDFLQMNYRIKELKIDWMDVLICKDLKQIKDSFDL